MNGVLEKVKKHARTVQGVKNEDGACTCNCQRKWNDENFKENGLN